LTAEIPAKGPRTVVAWMFLTWIAGGYVWSTNPRISGVGLPMRVRPGNDHR
jgi:hypothetical protein